MSLNYSSVRFMSNGEPIDQFVLNRPVEDLAKAVHNQMYNKTEVNNLKWHADSVNAGRLAPARLANGSAGNDFLPVYESSNGTTWRSFTHLLNKYANQIGGTSFAWQGQIYSSPTNDNDGRSTGLQIVSATYSSAPPGMVVGFQTRYRDTWWHGNGTSSSMRTGTFLAMKITTSSWVIFHANAQNR